MFWDLTGRWISVKCEIKFGHRVALQGNLDPTVRYANKNYTKQEVISVIESFGEGSGHIFNVGHGVLPDVDPENVKALVRFVKEESVPFHSKSI